MLLGNAQHFDSYSLLLSIAWYTVFLYKDVQQCSASLKFYKQFGILNDLEKFMLKTLAEIIFLQY